MPNSIPTASPSRLGHSLKPRQLIMMGLGSAIGAGLFLTLEDVGRRVSIGLRAAF